VQELDGKRVLVVGATSGIGRTVAVALAKQGATVAAAGRRREVLEDVRTQLGQHGLAVACDVRSAADCEDVVQSCIDAFGGLDAFIYAAGVSRLALLSQADASLWGEVLETNVIGASLVCRAALPHLRTSGGRAVFLGSSSVGRPFPGLSAYAASKAALDELVRGWRAENPDLSFTTLVVGPTSGTEFADLWDPDLAAKLFPFWERHGYLSASSAMEVADVGEAVCSVLTSSASLSTVAVSGYDRSADPAVL
jgi:NAD(P)-dependent dehydrogenase (short-subunit alcohol dehydrogenase family)